MDEKVDLPQAKNYLSVGEAAEALGLAASTLYQYIREGNINAEKIGSTIVLLRDEVASYRRGMAGRPRTSVPRWRFSPEENQLIVTSVEAELRQGVTEEDFVHILEQIKRGDMHLFPGTIARYILSDPRQPRRVRFLFFWRQTVMPNASTIEEALAALRQALADVLDWNGVGYETSRVWMHS
ncbi:MAG: helix-turn-helix domain-containing protein [Ktedonobacteraceae bacterium]